MAQGTTVRNLGDPRALGKVARTDPQGKHTCIWSHCTTHGAVISQETTGRAVSYCCSWLCIGLKVPGDGPWVSLPARSNFVMAVDMELYSQHGFPHNSKAMAINSTRLYLASTDFVMSELENHHRTHFFTAPCCLCAFSLGKTLVESRIGLVVVAPDGESSEVVGEYVAQCASKQCGYFVPLERFYARKVLKVKGYQKRATPLAPEQLSYICDVAPTHREPGGLAHVIPASMIWSKGTRTSLLVEKPLNLEQACTEFTNLWGRGVEEEIFWRLFVQDVFFSTHGPVGCWMRKGNVVWPLDLPEAPENINSDVSSAGDTEIINEHSSDDDTDDETDDEMPPLEDIEP
ncbi:hypothetical protein BKA70DRAFT_1230481 [Coprinopsis sp. MPI-PUGE-AT-0042]|nr:hypothetical protein BKA70DRAFT_1230481 [Coprinopsis sp. MPI-PUGE-AT-0042]